MCVTLPSKSQIMVPIQYIVSSQDVDAALAAGCRWIELSSCDDDISSLKHDCHAAGCFLVVQDAVEVCKETAADGVLLSLEGIEGIAAAQPKPSGIVLQQPRPVTTAIHAARAVLGEDTPQFIGVFVERPEDAVAAAKAGADFIQVPLGRHQELLLAVRERSFTTPVVALGTSFTPSSIVALLDEGLSGIACSISDISPLQLPGLLKADDSLN